MLIVLDSEGVANFVARREVNAQASVVAVATVKCTFADSFKFVALACARGGPRQEDDAESLEQALAHTRAICGGEVLFLLIEVDSALEVAVVIAVDVCLVTVKGLYFEGVAIPSKDLASDDFLVFLHLCGELCLHFFTALCVRLLHFRSLFGLEVTAMVTILVYRH